MHLGKPVLKRIHFMHIPKTGGTSLSLFLEQQFNAHEVCPYVYLRSAPFACSQSKIFVNPSPTEMNHYRLIKGHLGWVPRTFFSDSEIETITFIRDAAARCLSVYNAKNTHIHHHPICNRWQHFEDFIEDEIFGLKSHSNIATKHFCADLYLKKSLSSHLPFECVPGTGGLVSNVNIDISPKELLNHAIERLHSCSFVGITEYYEESFEWLCAQYHWDMPINIPRRNVSVKLADKFNIDVKLLNRIYEYNDLDMELYREALKLYHERKKTRVSINSIQEKNDISQANLSVRFDFKDRLIGEGWDAREGTMPTLFRWSIATTATMTLAVKPGRRYQLSFHVLHWLLTKFEEELTLTINSHPVPLNCNKLAEGGLVFTGTIEASMFHDKSPVLVLAFSIPTLKRPIDVDPESNDQRQLGFSCREVTIEPMFKARIKKIINRVFSHA